MKHSRRKTQWWRAVANLALFFSCSVFASPTFTVTSTADANDDNPGDGVCHTAAGTCTLRAAIIEANRVLSGGVTISLPAGTYTLQIPPNASNDEFSGRLKLTSVCCSKITIVGAGAATTIIDGNQLDRVMDVRLLREASIRGITIRGGFSMDGGAGLFNDGTLALNQTRIIGNAATGNAGGAVRNMGSLTLDRVDVVQNQAATGAGIYSDGVLAIRGSSIFDNQASNNGGGIFNAGQAQIINSTVSLNQTYGSGGGIETYGTTAITNSTVSLNQAGIGAGIDSKADLTIVDSTIANNHAQLKGGGVAAYPDAGKSVKIFNSTIAFNGAYSNGGDDGDGGGIYVDHGLVDMRNSLLVGNYYNGAQGSFEDCYTASAGVLRTFGVNLITTPNAFCNVTGSLSTLNSLDFLGPLKGNGGPTQTIALLQGGNAINAGINCTGPDGNPLPTDQRGFARVVGSACDVGAYEFDPDRIFTNGFE